MLGRHKGKWDRKREGIRKLKTVPKQRKIMRTYLCKFNENLKASTNEKDYRGQVHNVASGPK